eukprot:3045961-Amphidinium_carterae.1
MFSALDDVVRETLHGLLGSWLAMEWLLCLWVLRGLRMIGKRMLPVLRATSGAGGFWIILGFCIAGATNYYYVVAPDPIRKSFSESFHVVIKSVFFGDPFDIDTPLTNGRLGYLQDAGGPTDIDLYGAPEQDPLQRNLRRALAIGGLMVFVLMNIFIAIISKNYETALEAAESTFLHHRALIVVECTAIPWYRCTVNRKPHHILVLSPEPAALLEDRAARVLNPLSSRASSQRLREENSAYQYRSK